MARIACLRACVHAKPCPPSMRLHQQSTHCSSLQWLRGGRKGGGGEGKRPISKPSCNDRPFALLLSIPAEGRSGRVGSSVWAQVAAKLVVGPWFGAAGVRCETQKCICRSRRRRSKAGTRPSYSLWPFGLWRRDGHRGPSWVRGGCQKKKK